MGKLTFAKPTGAAKAKVLLIGDAGAGKTHMALTFPKPLMIDTEGGSEFFADRFDFQSTHTRSYSDILATLKEFAAKGLPGDTLVLDSITSIYNVLLSTYPNDQFLKMPKKQFRELIDFLYGKLPCHVVMTAWEKVEYAKPGELIDDGNGGQRKVKAGELIPLGYKMEGDAKALYAFDFVLRIIVDKKTGKRYAEVLKSRSGKYKVGDKIENPSWDMFKDLVDKGAFITRQTEEEAAEEDAAAVGAPDPAVVGREVAREVVLQTTDFPRGSNSHLKQMLSRYNELSAEPCTSVVAYMQKHGLSINDQGKVNEPGYKPDTEGREKVAAHLEAALEALQNDLAAGEKHGTPAHLAS